jgi:hypothetical protein
MPRSRAALTRFASEQLGPKFGDRIASLIIARPSYGGHRLRAESLRFALEFLAARREEWRPPDGVFLPASGNVQLLWRAGRVRIIAQFQPDRVVWFSVMNEKELQLTGRVSPQEFAAEQRIREAVAR